MKPQRIEGDPSRKLALHGLRATRQRVAVFRMLAEQRGHPTALEVYRRLVRQHPNLSQKTVYEILDALVEAGIAARIVEGGGPARFEIPHERHDHARCRVCGRLFDVPARSLRSRTGVPPGFLVEQIKVTIEGRCAACSERAAG
jgi:Fur family peroxide stress response transcriptional regulator